MDYVPKLLKRCKCQSIGHLKLILLDLGVKKSISECQIINALVLASNIHSDKPSFQSKEVFKQIRLKDLVMPKMEMNRATRRKLDKK